MHYHSPSRATRDHDPLGLYTITSEPTPAQLRAATLFFLNHPSRFLATHPRFLTLPQSSALPEVAFLGRSNAGKSSLLNALLCPVPENRTERILQSRKMKDVSRKPGHLSHVSRKPGRTRAMNAFLVGGDPATTNNRRQGWESVLKSGGAGGRMVVLDMPGYGHASRREWGEEVVKYLVGRKQLRRIFLLLPAHHNPTRLDLALLSLLREHSLPHQLVVSKADCLFFHRRLSPSSSWSSSSSSEFPLPKEEEEEASSPLHNKLLDTLHLGGSQHPQRRSYRDASSSSSSNNTIINNRSPRRNLNPTFLGDVLAVACGAAARHAGAGGGGQLKHDMGVAALRWAVLQAVGLDEWALKPPMKKRPKVAAAAAAAAFMPSDDHSDSDDDDYHNYDDDDDQGNDQGNDSDSDDTIVPRKNP
ncbi:MAG: hypothetical protein M1837_004223 [Sclerophora amabilis]|nr:MAG: hypothetical protein M1837_004223 [Sclerophora amabilis]